MNKDTLASVQKEINDLHESNKTLVMSLIQSLQVTNDLFLEITRYSEMIIHYHDIESKAIALLHLPFSATEAYEKARKELLEVITKDKEV